jgi:hypothetical protein
MTCGTPAVLRLLLLFYCEQVGGEAAAKLLLREGMIEEDSESGLLSTTSRGDCFIKHLLSVPFPEWAMPGPRAWRLPRNATEASQSGKDTNARLKPETLEMPGLDGGVVSDNPVFPVPGAPYDGVMFTKDGPRP